MRDYNKMMAVIVVAIIFTIIVNILMLFILNGSINEIKTRYLNETGIKNSEAEEEKISNENTLNIQIDEMTENTDIKEEGENNEKTREQDKEETRRESRETESIAKIRIPKITFQGEVYEGTTLEVLAKGVGHFDNTPYFDGNVCLAAHNTSKYWAKLKNLRKGDLITYECFLGTREYKVSEISQIEETDWSKLENTEENTLTLITCIKGVRPKRLCVIAKEHIS